MTIAAALRDRTFHFTVRTVRYNEQLSRQWRAREVGRQLLRSATGLAANYRAACRGRSRREFIARLDVGVEEADETVFWLDLIARTDLVEAASTRDLRDEAGELLAILSRSLRDPEEQLHTSQAVGTLHGDSLREGSRPAPGVTTHLPTPQLPNWSELLPSQPVLHGLAHIGGALDNRHAGC